MKFRLHLLFALILATCSIFAADDLDQEVKSTTLVQADVAAPDFTCQDITGRQYTLSALKGKVVLLYFFAASNPASVADLRYLETEIFQKLRNQDGFRLLAIGRDYQREELVKLGGENKVTFPLVADPTKEIYHRYFTKFVPRTVVIRTDGTIASQTSGAEYDKIVKLQSLLARELTFKTR